MSNKKVWSNELDRPWYDLDEDYQFVTLSDDILDNEEIVSRLNEATEAAIRNANKIKELSQQLDKIKNYLEKNYPHNKADTVFEWVTNALEKMDIDLGMASLASEQLKEARAVIEFYASRCSWGLDQGVCYIVNKDCYEYEEPDIGLFTSFGGKRARAYLEKYPTSKQPQRED